MAAKRISVMMEIGAVPPTINQLSRRHWSFRHRAGKEWEKFILAGIGDAKMLLMLRNASGRRRVGIKCVHLGVWDADNCQSAAKVILDALVRLGILESDGAAHVVLEPVTQERAKSRREICTRIAIWTLEATP